MTKPPGSRAARIECVRMHSGMVRKCSDNDRGMRVDTESVALPTDILPASSVQIGRDAPTCRRAVRRTNEPVLHEPDRLSAGCPEAQMSGEWDAPGQRTRDGEPTRPRIPRNGVVVAIIMVGPPSVSSWWSRPGRMFDPSRRVNTIGTANRSATPFFGKRLELHSRTGRSRCEVRVLAPTRRLREEFPSCTGAGPAGCTVRCRRTGGSLRAQCGIAGLHGAGNLAPCDGARTEHVRSTHGARRRPGTESVPGLRRACERTRPRRAPRRSPSGSHPRRRSARCHPRSPRPRPRVSRCGRRPRAG